MSGWINCKEQLPPLDVPVFVSGGNCEPMILIRSEDYDENGDPVWVWSYWTGGIYWDNKIKSWAVYDAEWDDCYEPEYWHAFPEPPDAQPFA